MQSFISDEGDGEYSRVSGKLTVQEDKLLLSIPHPTLNSHPCHNFIEPSAKSIFRHHHTKLQPRPASCGNKERCSVGVQRSSIT